MVDDAADTGYPGAMPKRTIPTLAVGYVRVSSDEQHKEGLGLPAQRERITRYCADKGIDLIRIFDEPEGVSGSTTARRGFDEAMQYLAMLQAQGKVASFIVTKIDRFARNLRFLLETVDTLESWGFAFVSTDEQYDTSHYAGRAVMSIFGAVAEMELGRIKERTRDAHAQIRAQGRRPGGGVPRFGLRAVTKAGVMVIPGEMRIVEELWRLFYIDRYSINNLTRLVPLRFNLPWDRSRLLRVLLAPAFLPLMPPDIREAALARGRKMPHVMEGYYRPFDPEALGSLTEKARERTAKMLGVVV